MVCGLFVEHFGGQAERGNVGAHQAAGLLVLFENHDFVAVRHQIVRDGQRRRTRADDPDALAVLLRRNGRQQIGDFAAMIGRDALQAADRDRLSIQPAAAARRLARPIAGAPQNRREHVRFAIQHVGVGKTPLRDQADVFRNIGVRGTRPLAIDDFMVISRIFRIRAIQKSASSALSRRGL